MSSIVVLVGCGGRTGGPERRSAPSLRAVRVINVRDAPRRPHPMSVQWRGKYLEAIDDSGWEYVRRVGGMSAAVILAVTDAGEVVLIEQHRPAVGGSSIELPAGLIGDEGPSSPRETAERELMEETGFTAQRWRYVGEFASSPGMSAEMFHFFLATGLSRTGAGGGIDNERIVTHLVPLKEIAAFAAAKREEGLTIDCRLIAFLPWTNLA